MVREIKASSLYSPFSCLNSTFSTLERLSERFVPGTSSTSDNIESLIQHYRSLGEEISSQVGFFTPLFLCTLKQAKRKFIIHTFRSIEFYFPTVHHFRERTGYERK